MNLFHYVTASMTENCYMGVIDIQSAYRSVQIYADHRRYQGLIWSINGRERYLEDNAICFGLKCAPFIFTQLTEFAIRYMERKGITKILGDYLVIAPSYEACQLHMHVLTDLLCSLGFVIAETKVKPPAQVMTYLGITLDSLSMEMRLPEEKEEKLSIRVGEFMLKTQTTVKELEVTLLMRARW